MSCHASLILSSFMFCLLLCVFFFLAFFLHFFLCLILFHDENYLTTLQIAHCVIKLKFPRNKKEENDPKAITMSSQANMTYVLITSPSTLIFYNQSSSIVLVYWQGLWNKTPPPNPPHWWQRSLSCSFSSFRDCWHTGIIPNLWCGVHYVYECIVLYVEDYQASKHRRE